MSLFDDAPPVASTFVPGTAREIIHINYNHSVSHKAAWFMHKNNTTQRHIKMTITPDPDSFTVPHYESVYQTGSDIQSFDLSVLSGKISLSSGANNNENTPVCVSCIIDLLLCSPFQ